MSISQLSSVGYPQVTRSAQPNVKNTQSASNTIAFKGSNSSQSDNSVLGFSVGVVTTLLLGAIFRKELAQMGKKMADKLKAFHVKVQGHNEARSLVRQIEKKDSYSMKDALELFKKHPTTDKNYEHSFIMKATDSIKKGLGINSPKDTFLVGYFYNGAVKATNLIECNKITPDLLAKLGKNDSYKLKMVKV